LINIKGKLSDYNEKSRVDIQKAVTEIFTGVDQEVLLKCLRILGKQAKAGDQAPEEVLHQVSKNQETLL
jgi:hypothetical protein